MAGRLTVCPTPIGNLGDISDRARQALTDADLVACEDTRRTGLLYERLELARPRLVSNHDQNEAERAAQLVQQIERGARVVLTTDAGTPVISDPGFRLVRACIERGLDVEVLPGPSAVTTALVASGLPPDRWRFEGFLPRRAGELERVLLGGETVIAFESPRRLPDSLAALATLAPERPAAVCRELTKLHEEIARGTLSELARKFREDVKGEIVLVIAPSGHGQLEPRHRVRGGRAAPLGPGRRPSASRRERRRGAHRNPRQRPLHRIDGPRAPRIGAARPAPALNLLLIGQLAKAGIQRLGSPARDVKSPGACLGRDGERNSPRNMGTSPPRTP